MTLSIRPVRLNRSIYLRVPNDIADLIEIDHQAEVTLGLEEQEDRFRLIYSIRKKVDAPLTRIQPSRAEYDRAEVVTRSKHGRFDA